MNRFRKNDAKPCRGCGARARWYAFESGLTLEIGYGASKGPSPNAHFKSSWKTSLGKGRATMATISIS